MSKFNLICIGLPTLGDPFLLIKSFIDATQIHFNGHCCKQFVYNCLDMSNTK